MPALACLILTTLKFLHADNDDNTDNAVITILLLISLENKQANKMAWSKIIIWDHTNKGMNVCKFMPPFPKES